MDKPANDAVAVTYLNHAGTSWPKPASVLRASHAVLATDPMEWPGLFETACEAIAGLFHVAPSRLLFTPSCTAALAVAIFDHVWRPGDRVLTSGYEHHALERNLVKLAEWGVVIDELPRCSEALIDLEQLERELKQGRVRMVALTAACNVTGELLPYHEAIALAHAYEALVLVDGAQIAGWWEFDLAALRADLVTFAGHKGPQAPWGIGGLYVAPGVMMNSPGAACEIAPADTKAAVTTVSRQEADAAVGLGARACAPMPGYCDVGSVNMAALAGLAAAIEWLRLPAQRLRLDTARTLTAQFTEAIRALPGVSIYGDVDAHRKMPTVAISIANHRAAALSAQLREQGIVVSGGFQCAPRAHEALGTAGDGVIRFSFGPTSTADDAEAAASALTRLVT